MHTTIGPQGTCFNHNGDFSGLIKFSVPFAGEEQPVDVEAPFNALVRAATFGTGRWSRVNARREDNDEVCTVEVLVADLRALVASRVRGDRIEALEEMEDDALFANALATEVPTWAAALADWD